MGGEISHEYHLLSEVGEDKLKICETCSEGTNIELDSNTCFSCGSSSFRRVTGIEVFNASLN